LSANSTFLSNPKTVVFAAFLTLSAVAMTNFQFPSWWNHRGLS
jgi:hypothetical protein